MARMIVSPFGKPSYTVEEPELPPAFCESPIESDFLDALNEICRSEYLKRTGPDEAPITIRPQAHIGRYRCDFLVEQGLTKLVIECDGHDYHERTKEQAEHDRFRDRYMQECGYVVFRFTGSEIHADAYRCARQAFDFITQRAGERAAIRDQILGAE